MGRPGPARRLGALRMTGCSYAALAAAFAAGIIVM